MRKIITSFRHFIYGSIFSRIILKHTSVYFSSLILLFVILNICGFFISQMAYLTASAHTVKSRQYYFINNIAKLNKNKKLTARSVLYQE